MQRLLDLIRTIFRTQSINHSAFSEAEEDNQPINFSYSDGAG